ncbi:MAG: hypothetical protein MI757_18990 [Pirellulales bacterium]|nr:hypothetical protein [Pirellulales bacterium]
MCAAGLALLIAATNCRAAVFQYAVPVETRKGERLAYLWIPPESERVRGIVMGGMTLMERELAQDPHIRKACAENDLAIVFLKTGLRSVDVDALLAKLAEKSGYSELANAPLLFVGHSAGGPQAKALASSMSERCFGLVQYRGGDPLSGEPVPAGIPTLNICGQFDEFGKIGRDAQGVDNWEKDRDKMVDYRSADPNNIGNFLVEPGAGHFAWSDRCAEYLALFIAKAAHARIPDDPSKGELKRIDVRGGWLTDPSIKPAGKHKPAPYDEYTGDKTKAMWHFDEEIARASVAFCDGVERNDQFISWKDPHRVQSGARNFFNQVKWVDDGQTFEVHPKYSSTYPPKPKGRGSVWGKAGQPVGNSGAPIKVKPVSGPLVKSGKHRLRIRYNELAPATEQRRMTFMAYSDGNDEYRYTERVGMLGDEFAKFTDGKPQSITFPPLADLRSANATVTLKATSDSGLDVECHIAYGPATVKDGMLHVADLPKRAKLPIEIKVVAYQFGRGLKPLVQTAKPVEQTIQLVGR